jgi:serine/threonine protein kinase
MRYAHDFHIIHRDLKPGNIFVDEHFRPYIGDLGGAKVDKNGSLSQDVGTYAYMAPEEDSHGHGSALDVFSYGITAWVVFTGSRKLSSRAAIQRGNRPDIKQIRDPEIAKMIQQAWDQVPSHRPTFARICEFWERHTQEVIDEYKTELDRKEAELRLENKGELLEMLRQLAKASTGKDIQSISNQPLDDLISMISRSLKGRSDNFALILALRESCRSYGYINKFLMMERDRRMTDSSVNSERERIRNYARHFHLNGLEGIEGPELAVMETYLGQVGEDPVVLYTLGEYWKKNGDRNRAIDYFERCIASERAEMSQALNHWNRSEFGEVRMTLEKPFGLQSFEDAARKAIQELSEREVSPNKD